MTRAIVIAGEGFHIPYPTPLRLWFDLTSLLGGKVVGALILAGLILAGPQWRRADIQVFSLWATLPFAVGLAASVLLTPVLAARYVAGSLPPILLISAWGLLRFFVGRQMVLAAAVAGAWAAVALFRADPYSKEKEDWRSVAAFLAANFGSSDCILIVPKRDVLSLQYYRADDRGCVLSTSDVGGLPSPIDARRLFYVFKTIVRAAADEVKVALEADGWVEGARSVYAGIEIVELSRPE
jgi:hypothetical protein